MGISYPAFCAVKQASGLDSKRDVLMAVLMSNALSGSSKKGQPGYPETCLQQSIRKAKMPP